MPAFIETLRTKIGHDLLWLSGVSGVVEVERLVSVMSLEPKVCPNGDLVQFLDLTFACRYVSGQARVCDDENLDVGWFDMLHCLRWAPAISAGSGRRSRASRSRTSSPETPKGPSLTWL
jgi:hypothetical protein